MCVSSSVRDTNAPTTGRGRLLPLDYHFISFYILLSAAAMETKKQHWNKNLLFLIYLWSMSTSHLYAHLFMDMCTMD